jgi:hypothetical protein
MRCWNSEEMVKGTMREVFQAGDGFIAERVKRKAVPP